MDGANLRFMYIACFYLVKGLLPSSTSGWCDSVDQSAIHTRLNKCLTAGFDSFQFINRIRGAGVGRAQYQHIPDMLAATVNLSGSVSTGSRNDPNLTDHKIMYHRRRSPCVVSRPTEDGRTTRVASLFMLINI